MESPVPSRLNVDDPQLAPEVAFFLEHGYLVVDDAIDAAQVGILRTAVDELHARKTGEHIGALLEEDERFVPLLDNPPVLRRIRAILGTCVQLHSATTRFVPPGNPAQSWHRDGPWPIHPRGTPYGALPGQINCGYYLDRLTPDNGPVIVLPGSHRVPFRPPVGSPEFPDQVAVLATPGQAVLFDGWLFHRGGANTSAAPRRSCFMCYQHAWMKSREDFSGPRVSALRAAGDPQRRLLLGEVGSW